MVSTKGGGSNGPRKRGARKPRHSGTGPDTHTRTNSTNAQDDALDSRAAAASADDGDSDKQRVTQAVVSRSTVGTSIPGSGPSGGQAQMVFTVGTFDEDDGEYIGHEVGNTILKTPQDQHDKRHQQQNYPEDKENLSVEAEIIKDDSHVSLSKAAQAKTEQAMADQQVSEILHFKSKVSETARSPAASGMTASQQPQARRQPLFTMGSHSEVSDSDSSDSYDGPLLASHGRDSMKHDTARKDADSHPEPTSKSKQKQLGDQIEADTIRGCHASTNNECSNDCIANFEKDTGERTRSPCVLHLCKATTSLSQLHSQPNTEQTNEQDAGPGLSKMAPAALVRRERVASAPPARSNSASSAKGDDTSSSDVIDEEQDISEPHCRSNGKMAATREAHLKPRKKATNKKLHAKRTTSTAALRTRTRHGGGGYRRDFPLAKPLLSTVNAANESQVDSSYVDYSGNSSFGDDTDPRQTDGGTQQQTGGGSLPNANSDAIAVNSNVLDQSKASLNSSTATLGVGAGQEIDDSATTASIDSPHQEHIEELANFERANETNAIQQQKQQKRQNQHTTSRVVDSASPNVLPSTTMAEAGHSQSSAYGLSDAPGSSNMATSSYTDPVEELYKNEGGARRQRKQVRSRGPEQVQFQGQSSRTSDEQAANTSSSQTTYISKSSKRNIESQRQQGIVEKEEEHMDIANSHLTGVPRRSNRPAGMMPYVFLLPDLPAYGQQVRKTDRLYAYSRTLAHPLLESMVRCAELREQRLALRASASRGNSRPWASRRILNEPSEADSQAEWWDSLMPPPLSSAPYRDQRVSSRMKLAELPSWMVEPDDAKRMVYGSEMDPLSAHGHHDLTDPSCPHIRELRTRAKELRISRQHNATAGRNSALPSMRALAPTSEAALETWRGRRIPGLLNVDMYTGAIGPLDSGAKQGGRWLESETPFSSSPENTNSNLTRGNQLAPPYRRYGTVYGYTAANAANSRASANASVPGALGGGSGGIQASLRSNSRGHESMPSSRPGTAGIWESDPRRSSYFDRISVDELRPNVVSSAATQTTPAGLLRRVISGLTGATAAFGTSQ